MDLSIVIAAYNMQRELPRTLLSALPPYQRNVEGINYEIVVVDNGSPEPISWPDFSLTEIPVQCVRISPDQAKSSPVECINDVVASCTSGKNLLICIDGARMFSPYLVRRTMDVLFQHPSAFTFVASRHLGNEVQMKSMAKGYNQAVEDQLLAAADWMNDLDKLWEISVWAGAHEASNFLGQNESNALGFSRSLWHEVGGYNLGFQRPGGGLCNLELFQRTVQREHGLNVLLLGEATFHQFHGGAATASPGYFNDSLQEHENATGAKYRRPKFNFLAETGAVFQRFQKIGQHLRD